MKRSLTMLGGILLLQSATSAFGDSLVMQCNKTDCVRQRCDESGENCKPAGYFQGANGQFIAPQSHEVCDEFGDCHFAMPSFPPTNATTSPAPAAAVVPAATTPAKAAPATATPH
jgi:hypothetical protein